MSKSKAVFNIVNNMDKTCLLIHGFSHNSLIPKTYICKYSFPYTSALQV
jgi:hypothetical protein